MAGSARSARPPPSPLAPPHHTAAMRSRWWWAGYPRAGTWRSNHPPLLPTSCSAFHAPDQLRHKMQPHTPVPQ
eukprot:8139980-Pyramimonas_sp.AAC.1